MSNAEGGKTGRQPFDGINLFLCSTDRSRLDLPPPNITSGNPTSHVLVSIPSLINALMHPVCNNLSL